MIDRLPLHRINLFSPRWALPLILLILALSITTILSASTPAEEDHFHFIVELFDASEAYTEEVRSEIWSFTALYPNSEYNLYIEYISGCLALREADFSMAQSIFQDLYEQQTPPDIIADVYLSYAVCCYQIGDLSFGLSLLKDLANLTTDQYYIYQSHVWRGRIYSLLGQNLSAGNEYLQALQTDSLEVRYDYFLLLLSDGREEEARLLWEQTPPDASDYLLYERSWLKYLLSIGDYEQFDAEITRLVQTEDSDPEISLLQVRKALDLEDYNSVSVLLDKVEGDYDLKTFYQAMLMTKTGQVETADSLLKRLLQSDEENLPLYAYLERLNILYNRNSESAIKQLAGFLADPNNQDGVAFQRLGEFYFRAGRYAEAIPVFVNAMNFPLSYHLEDSNEALLAQSCYYVNDLQTAQDIFNRYLNRQTQGRFRDTALFFLGKIAQVKKDRQQETLNFNQLLSKHPQSPYANEAKFLLAELYYGSAEYAAADTLYRGIALTPENTPVVQLRIAQVSYYLDRLEDSEQALNSIPSDQQGFDATILRAGISFSRKDYTSALELYDKAFQQGGNANQQTEAKAYQAYTLYYLKRYTEASQLFYDLSRDSLNADIYLYQAAKSASQGMQWQRALDLYNQFIDEFDVSDYLQAVLSETATTLFNIGRYRDSLTDWLNLLRRFTVNTFVNREEQSLLGEIFTGIETCCRALDDPSAVAEVAGVIENFSSDYIKFELEFIVVKLFANAELWDEVLREATSLRSELNLPEARRMDIDLLMAQSLVKLNQYAQADTLLTEINTSNQTSASLLSWAELADISGNTELALERYLQVYALVPDTDIWLKLLSLSEQSGFQRFSELWDLGLAYQPNNSPAKLIQINYFLASGDFGAAQSVADSLLAVESNRQYRAQAELVKTRILYQNESYQEALRGFRKVRMIYREYPEAFSQATYYYILCLIRLDARQEAELTLAEDQEALSPEQKEEIANILGEQR